MWAGLLPEQATLLLFGWSAADDHLAVVAHGVWRLMLMLQWDKGCLVGLHSACMLGHGAGIGCLLGLESADSGISVVEVRATR